MPSIVKILRTAADPTRLRILLLLGGEELSVAELQEILVMGQSTISTHLSQLKQAGLVEDRRTGKNNLYRLVAQPLGELETGRVLYQGATSAVPQRHENKERALAPEGRFLDQLLNRAATEIPEVGSDQAE